MNQEQLAAYRHHGARAERAIARLSAGTVEAREAHAVARHLLALGAKGDVVLRALAAGHAALARAEQDEQEAQAAIDAAKRAIGRQP